MIISKADQKSYESLQKDMAGSILSKLNVLFTKAHLVSVTTDPTVGRTYATFEYVADGVIRKDTLSFNSILFAVAEKK